MTQKQFFDAWTFITDADLELAKKKNHDYAGENDALKNFELFGAYGVAVRLSDKLMRMINWFKSGELKVDDEGIRDTLRDIRNYAVIAEIMLNELEVE